MHAKLLMHCTISVRMGSGWNRLSFGTCIHEWMHAIVFATICPSRNIQYTHTELPACRQQQLAAEIGAVLQL